MRKDDILKKLREAGDFVSGQELSGHYGVSRTAIWKAMRQLERDGYKIEAQSNRGYRLVETGGVFSAVEIESRLDTSWAGKRLVFHRETGSTNVDAKMLAEKGCEAGTLVVADMQSAGRGRRGRGWVAPAGKNIYMTLVLRPGCSPDRAASLTLVMAIAVFEAVREILPGEGCGIKWPNDVVVNGKKVCGILTEMSAEPECIHYVVTGVGINVDQDEFPVEIMGMATSIYIEGGRMNTDRARLVARVMHYFEENYGVFEKTWDLSGLAGKYNSFLVNCGREVRVLDPGGEFDGIAYGINEKGELVVERASDGKMVAVYSGEVSVRGIYGYV